MHMHEREREEKNKRESWKRNKMKKKKPLLFLTRARVSEGRRKVMPLTKDKNFRHEREIYGGEGKKKGRIRRNERKEDEERIRFFPCLSSRQKNNF